MHLDDLTRFSEVQTSFFFFKVLLICSSHVNHRSPMFVQDADVEER